MEGDVLSEVERVGHVVIRDLPSFRQSGDKATIGRAPYERIEDVHMHILLIIGDSSQWVEVEGLVTHGDCQISSLHNFRFWSFSGGGTCCRRLCGRLRGWGWSASCHRHNHKQDCKFKNTLY